MKSDPPITPEDTISLQKLLRAKLLSLMLPAWAEDLLMKDCDVSAGDLVAIVNPNGTGAEGGSRILEHGKLAMVEHWLRRWNAGGITRDGAPVLDERSPHRGKEDAVIPSVASPDPDEPTPLRTLLVAAAATAPPPACAPVVRDRPFVFQTPAAIAPARRTVKPREPRPAIAAPAPTPQPQPETQPQPRMKTKTPVSKRQKELLARYEAMDKPHGSGVRFKELAGFKNSATLHEFRTSQYAFKDERLDAIESAIDEMSAGDNANGSAPKSKAAKGHSRAPKRRKTREPRVTVVRCHVSTQHMIEAVTAVQEAEAALNKAKQHLADLSLAYAKRTAA